MLALLMCFVSFSSLVVAVTSVAVFDSSVDVVASIDVDVSNVMLVVSSVVADSLVTCSGFIIRPSEEWRIWK